MGANAKVYAVGYRSCEVGLPLPNSKQMDSGSLHIPVPPVRRKRSVNYRRLNFGAVPGYAPLSTDRRDTDTNLLAIRKRLVSDLPDPAPGFYSDFAAFVLSVLPTLFSPVRVGTFEGWLDGAPYTLKRKEELRVLHDRLRGERPSLKLCRKIKSFLKLESYGEYKFARGINSRTDWFKAWSGRYFKAVEEEVYKSPWFIKHVPIPERAALINALKIYGVHISENDYKNFEGSIRRKVMLACECLVYTYLLQNYPEDVSFICQVISGKNEIRTSTGLFYWLMAHRMSGDMCTSVGNGLTNLFLVLYIAHLKGAHVKGFVEGDDGIFACDAPLTADDFEKCGFKVEIHEVRDPAHAHFCGMTFSSSGDIIKDPRRVLQSFGWTSSFVHAGNAVMDSLLKSKALSLAYELPQCPILGVLARVTLDLTADVDMTHRDEHWGRDWNAILRTPIPDFAPAQSTRELFAEMYHVSIPMQLVAERAIRVHDLSYLSEILPAPRDVAHYYARYVEVG